MQGRRRRWWWWAAVVAVAATVTGEGSSVGGRHSLTPHHAPSLSRPLKSLDHARPPDTEVESHSSHKELTPFHISPRTWRHLTTALFWRIIKDRLGMPPEDTYLNPGPIADLLEHFKTEDSERKEKRKRKEDVESLEQAETQGTVRERKGKKQKRRSLEHSQITHDEVIKIIEKLQYDDKDNVLRHARKTQENSVKKRKGKWKHEEKKHHSLKLSKKTQNTIKKRKEKQKQRNTDNTLEHTKITQDTRSLGEKKLNIDKKEKKNDGKNSPSSLSHASAIAHALRKHAQGKVVSRSTRAINARVASFTNLPAEHRGSLLDLPAEHRESPPFIPPPAPPQPPAPAPYQYHHHDHETGVYVFGYGDGQQWRHEERGPKGQVRGGYGWRDERGKNHVTHFVADTSGYRVVPRDKQVWMFGPPSDPFSSSSPFSSSPSPPASSLLLRSEPLSANQLATYHLASPPPLPSTSLTPLTPTTTTTTTTPTTTTTTTTTTPTTTTTTTTKPSTTLSTTTRQPTTSTATTTSKRPPTTTTTSPSTTTTTTAPTTTSTTTSTTPSLSSTTTAATSTTTSTTTKRSTTTKTTTTTTTTTTTEPYPEISTSATTTSSGKRSSSTTTTPDATTPPSTTSTSTTATTSTTTTPSTTTTTTSTPKTTTTESTTTPPTSTTSTTSTQPTAPSTPSTTTTTTTTSDTADTTFATFTIASPSAAAAQGEEEQNDSLNTVEPYLPSSTIPTGRPAIAYPLPPRPTSWLKPSNTSKKPNRVITSPFRPVNPSPTRYQPPRPLRPLLDLLGLPRLRPRPRPRPYPGNTIPSDGPSSAENSVGEEEEKGEEEKNIFINRFKLRPPPRPAPGPQTPRPPLDEVDDSSSFTDSQPSESERDNVLENLMSLLQDVSDYADPDSDTNPWATLYPYTQQEGDQPFPPPHNPSFSRPRPGGSVEGQPSASQISSGEVSAPQRPPFSQYPDYTLLEDLDDYEYALSGHKPHGGSSNTLKGSDEVNTPEGSGDTFVDSIDGSGDMDTLDGGGDTFVDTIDGSGDTLPISPEDEVVQATTLGVQRNPQESYTTWSSSSAEKNDFTTLTPTTPTPTPLPSATPTPSSFWTGILKRLYNLPNLVPDVRRRRPTIH